MARIDDAQIEAARSIDLLSYLQTHEPGCIRISGPGEYCLREHDSLKISNGKWFWFSRGFGSNNALDFLVQVRGMEFTQAVETLTDGRAAAYTSLSSRSPPTDKPRKLFALPMPNDNNYHVTAYLMGRGINRDIIDRCIAERTLYESRKHHNCIFVGRNAEGTARFACSRSTSGDFKKDVAGSDKRYAFSIPAAPESSAIMYVFKAPIDLLSCASLRHEENPVRWNDVHYLSLGGTTPLALEQYLKDHPAIKNIAICLDNDAPGREATVRIAALLEGEGYSVTDAPPPSGKDYNAHLLHVRQEQKDTGRSEKDAAISL